MLPEKRASFIITVIKQEAKLNGYKKGYLDPEWCNVLRLVDVVVQLGGEREEPVGRYEELLHLQDHGFYIKWHLRNGCARKKQYMLFDLIKAFDQIESSINKSDFFLIK